MNEKFLVAAAVMLVLGGSLALGFGGQFLRAWRERQILRDGTAAEAVIIDLRDTGSRVNRDPVLVIVLEVRRPDGSSYRAEVTRIVGLQDVDLFARGRVVPVKFDPARPERVAIVERRP
jgi:hypothetical protein